MSAENDSADRLEYWAKRYQDYFGDAKHGEFVTLMRTAADELREVRRVKEKWDYAQANDYLTSHDVAEIDEAMRHAKGPDA